MLIRPRAQFRDLSSSGLSDAVTVENLAALKALTSRPESVIVKTGQAAGVWQWVSDSSTTADDGIVVQCTAGASGRYKRVFDGAYYTHWWGDTFAAAQAAIDALPADGGTVIVTDFYEGKNLYLNGTARDKENVVLTGLGFSTGFKFEDEAGLSNLIDGLGAVGCRVENMKIDGNRANQTIIEPIEYEKYNGVYLEEANRCAVVDCYIINMAVIAVCPGAPWDDMVGADRCDISDNTFDDCQVPIAAMLQRGNTITGNKMDGDDMVYAITVDVASVGNLVDNNIIGGTTSSAIFLYRASKNIVSNNRVDSCEVSINLSDEANDNIVIGNHCTNAGNSNIILQNSSVRNKVANNHLYDAVQYNIYVATSSAYSTISDNFCRGASFSNIALSGITFSLVEGNFCYEANGSGIYLGGTCSWTEVFWNYCFNNGLTSANEGGIRLVDQNNIIVEENKCFDSQSTKTQAYGIRGNEGTMGTVSISDNDVRFNLTAGMALSGTPIVKDNLGWVTEATGNFTAGAAAAGVTVTHGMDMTPDYRCISVTLIGAFTLTTRLSVANVGATTFDVFIDPVPGGAGQVIGWNARVQP